MDFSRWMDLFKIYGKISRQISNKTYQISVETGIEFVYKHSVCTIGKQIAKA